FELGLALYFIGNLTDARHHFEEIDQKNSMGLLNPLSQFYLARIELAEHHYFNAQSILDKLSGSIRPEQFIHYELAYLKGEVSYQLSDYQKACFFFEQALPFQNAHRMHWYRDTLYHLGWSYLKFADSPNEAVSNQFTYFNKAEETFMKLLEQTKDEQVFLAL